MLSSMLDFASKVVGSAACIKFEEFPTMSVTTMRISTMPSSDIGSVSRPVQEPQKQASLYFKIKACFYPTEIFLVVFPAAFVHS